MQAKKEGALWLTKIKKKKKYRQRPKRMNIQSGTTFGNLQNRRQMKRKKKKIPSGGFDFQETAQGMKALCSLF